MVTRSAELQKAAQKFNEIFSLTGLDLKVVIKTESTAKTAKKVSIVAPPLAEEYVFEEFDGSVHTYILKDGAGNPVKSFKYLPKTGEERFLKCGEGETIQVLDFKNTDSEAINGWQVKCTYPDVDRLQEVINAGVDFDNGVYTIKSVIANARVPAGKTLSKKIIYKVATTKLAISHSFVLKSAEIPSKVPDAVVPSKIKTSGKYDYVKALKLMPYFFEANISGKKPSWSRVKWRGDATMKDANNQGFYNIGGYYDAGDMLLLLNTTGYSFSCIAFAMHFEKKVFEQTGQMGHYKNILRHATDYCMAITKIAGKAIKKVAYWCPNPSSLSHNEWKIPEKSTHARNALVANNNSPASECAGVAAACLALASLVFKDSDKAYADKCLTYAKMYFDFGNKYQGKYKHSKVYKSNHIHDELSWGAGCLYLATKEKWYLDLANKYYIQNVKWASWFA